MSKINFTQKEILGNFMAKHTDLAKSILPNTAQGKARANQLWDHLAGKLNASGPPVKDAKMWRKVYADQKQNVKKKVSFNKSSKKRTGGGPYEEKVLSQVEEQILEAAGIEVAVEGLKNVKSYGSLLQSKSVEELSASTFSEKNNESYAFASTSQEKKYDVSATSPTFISDNEEMHVQQELSYIIESEDDGVGNKCMPNKSQVMYKDTKRETKTTLLKRNISSIERYQTEMLKRYDQLIDINNKNLKLKEKEVDLTNQLVRFKQKILDMKENEHKINLQIKEMELKIKIKEMEKLTAGLQNQPKNF